MPLSLKTDMSAFKYASLLSIACLTYTAIVLLIELPNLYKENHDLTPYQPLFLDFNLLTGASMTFFAFQCQVQLLPIYSELVNPEYRRISKVIDRAVSVDLIFYGLVAAAGFFSQFNQTAKIVLERGTDRDIPILIAILGVIISILVAFPLGYNPFRSQLVM